MTRRLHLGFGGELASRQQSAFKPVRQIAVLGIHAAYATAFSARKAGARRRVDSAHMRYFIAHLQRLREDGPEAEAMQA